ncbi:cytochrome d ubiquinol oxidase subunit II [Microlunatus sp. Gsoil 973]|uniref:cytochrome d ubiquinol oxidase subunit II n=1 Tax=Microlunatus sp. Gsoil 973 TaxID=2672569 RepID=UPI0012B493F3|nr:cytochrome d ubiquinol oxidase subunit II [Microlunatus sp. Gsoil 973]QGN34606.1 cytochrome d ubiquinol oxidase subunit II [Microlunatus sp. Gsoil 973]
MDLTTVWFIIEAVLWIGYFVLEGFDFGVGLSLPLIGRKDRERHAVLSTIMPVWDGNEVWVIVAGGAMFAAFPGWYATTFSTFYLPLLAILVGLIVRAVGLEYREHREDAAWRRRWDLCIIIGSFLPALLWGVAFGNIVRGLPINAQHDFTGSLLDLLNPFALLAGLVTLSLFLTHGSVFLVLRTSGELRLRAKRQASVVGAITVVLGVGLLFWLNRLPGIENHRAVLVCSIITALALLFGLGMHLLDRDGWSFAGTAVTVGGLVITLFTALYPRLIPSTTNPEWSLTIHNSSATHYTLTIMTWSAVVLVPIVIAYQAWSYWTFRKRITLPAVDVADPSLENRPAPASPSAAK